MDAISPEMQDALAQPDDAQKEYERDYGLARWADLSTDDFERFMREAEL
jgi:hypothetical protein